MKKQLLQSFAILTFTIALAPSVLFAQAEFFQRGVDLYTVSFQVSSHTHNPIWTRAVGLTASFDSNVEAGLFFMPAGKFTDDVIGVGVSWHAFKSAGASHFGVATEVSAELVGESILAGIVPYYTQEIVRNSAKVVIAFGGTLHSAKGTSFQFRNLVSARLGVHVTRSMFLSWGGTFIGLSKSRWNRNLRSVSVQLTFLAN